jgi:hypothetical protein
MVGGESSLFVSIDVCHCFRHACDMVSVGVSGCIVATNHMVVTVAVSRMTLRAAWITYSTSKDMTSIRGANQRIYILQYVVTSDSINRGSRVQHSLCVTQKRLPKHREDYREKHHVSSKQFPFATLPLNRPVYVHVRSCFCERGVCIDQQYQQYRVQHTSHVRARHAYI